MSIAAKLPKPLRDKIKDLFRDGYTTDDVFGKVLQEAIRHVDSHEELIRCIASLEGKVTLEE